MLRGPARIAVIAAALVLATSGTLKTLPSTPATAAETAAPSASAGSPPNGAAQASPSPVLRRADPLEAKVAATLERGCARCHQAGYAGAADPARPPHTAGGAAGGLADILDLSRLAKDRSLVQPGLPDGSRLYTLMLERHAPFEPAEGPDADAFDAQWPSAEQVQGVRDWIARKTNGGNAPDCAEQPALAPASLRRAVNTALWSVDVATAARLRFVSFAHLARSCLPGSQMAAARRGMGDLLAGLAKTRSASELAAPLEGSHGTILRLDLAALGLTPAEWDARIAAVGSSVAPDVTAEHRLATALTGGVTPDTSATGRQLLVAADWMAQALAQPSASMPSIATTTPPASTTPSATTTAAPPPAPVRHLELAAAPRPTADILTLRRLHTRPVDLVRAAGELGQPVDALAARLKVDGGVSAWRAQRLLSGTLSRASWTDLAAHLSRRDDDERTDRQVATHRPAAVSPSSTDTPAQPGPRTGTLLLPPMQPDTRLGSAAAEGEPSLPAPTSPPARDVAATTATQSRPTAGPASLSKATVTQRAEVALWLDRDAYRLGDPIVIHAASDRACHLTVINVDVDGKATVIFPNAYQTDNRLDAAATITLPGAAAPFTFKAREQGRETLIAICQDDATPPLGMTHDFERRRFTVLGNWRVYLSLAYQGAPPVTLEARPAPRRTRRRRKAADPAEPPAIFAPAGRAAVSYVIN